MAQVTINKTTLECLESGDLVEFKRDWYSHWAVYIGEHEIKGKKIKHAVVHLAGIDNEPLQSTSIHSFTIFGKQFDKAEVCIDDFWEVAGNCRVLKNNSKDKKFSPFDHFNIVKRALSQLGPIPYSVLRRNCEHFASWCRYGKAESEQRALSELGSVAYNALTMNCEHFASWCCYGKPESKQVDNLILGGLLGAAAVLGGFLTYKAITNRKERNREDFED